MTKSIPDIAAGCATIWGADASTSRVRTPRRALTTHQSHLYAKLLYFSLSSVDIIKLQGIHWGGTLVSYRCTCLWNLYVWNHRSLLRGSVGVIRDYRAKLPEPREQKLLRYSLPSTPMGCATLFKLYSIICKRYSNNTCISLLHSSMSLRAQIL